MMTETCLIAIAVGPVQEFIISARKMRDLWYGSHLLSELSKSVARSLFKQNCKLIFPSISDEKDLLENSSLNVANKILASFEGTNPTEDIVRRAEEEFNSFWLDICSKARRGISGDAIDDKIFNAQIRDFGEFFGAWTTCNPSQYKETRARLDQLLAGRKCLRDFSPPAWEGIGLAKSSLDGVRETVLKNRGALENNFSIKKGEELDAMGIVKRTGPWSSHRKRKPHFSSTSEIAILPFLSGIEKDEFCKVILEKLNNYISQTKLSNLPAQKSFSRVSSFLSRDFPAELLFPSRLEELIADNALKNDENWKAVKDILHELYARLRLREPQPYYCIFVGDGDHMGKTLDKLDTPDKHREFSNALNLFAGSVHEVVEKYDGRLVYSGGDDVMAYVPLHTAVECVGEVRSSFMKTMEKGCAEIGCTPPTFSVGAVIVHHLTPLHDALTLARKAEQHAKEDGGRDALAIIQAKRSGQDLLIHGKWDTAPACPGLPERLKFITALYEEGKLSRRLGYQLRTAARSCEPVMKWCISGERVIPGNTTAAEALRISRRKQGRTKESLDDTLIEKLLLSPVEHPVRELSDMLVIAGQFAGAAMLANAVRIKGEMEAEA